MHTAAWAHSVYSPAGTINTRRVYPGRAPGTRTLSGPRPSGSGRRLPYREHSGPTTLLISIHRRALPTPNSHLTKRYPPQPLHHVPLRADPGRVASHPLYLTTSRRRYCRGPRLWGRVGDTETLVGGARGLLSTVWLIGGSSSTRRCARGHRPGRERPSGQGGATSRRRRPASTASSTSRASAPPRWRRGRERCLRSYRQPVRCGLTACQQSRHTLRRARGCQAVEDRSCTVRRTLPRGGGRPRRAPRPTTRCGLLHPGVVGDGRSPAQVARRADCRPTAGPACRRSTANARSDAHLVLDQAMHRSLYTAAPTRSSCRDRCAISCTLLLLR